MEGKKNKKLIFNKYKLCARHWVGCFICFEKARGQNSDRDGGREGGRIHHSFSDLPQGHDPAHGPEDPD